MCKEICYTFRGMELNKVYHFLPSHSCSGDHVELEVYKAQFREGNGKPLQYSCLENPH